MTAFDSQTIAGAVSQELRWDCGVLFPGASTRTEVRIPAGTPGRARIVIRFSQVQARSIEAYVGDDFLPVARVTVDEADYVSTEESVLQERRFEFDARGEGSDVFPITIPGGLETDTIFDASGKVRGRIVRERWPLRASALVKRNRTRDGLLVRMTVSNDSDVISGADRAVAQRTSLISTNVALSITRSSIKGET